MRCFCFYLFVIVRPLLLSPSQLNCQSFHGSFSLACYFSFPIVSLEKERIRRMRVAINWFSKLKIIRTNFCSFVHLNSFTAKQSDPRRKLPWVLARQETNLQFSSEETCMVFYHIFVGKTAIVIRSINQSINQLYLTRVTRDSTSTE